MHNNVSHDFSVSLSCKDVVDARIIAYPFEGMRNDVHGVIDESVHQGKIMAGNEG